MALKSEMAPFGVTYIKAGQPFDTYTPSPAGWDHARAVLEADKQWKILHVPPATNPVVDTYVDFLRDGKVVAYFKPTHQGWDYSKAVLSQNRRFIADNPAEVKAAADWREQNKEE